MKTGGTASKVEIAAEVATLLDLKGRLAKAQGIDPAAADKDKKKNKKGGGAGKENTNPSTPNTASAASPTAAPSSNAPVDEAEVSRLQALVTQQVRVHSCVSSGVVIGKERLVLVSPSFASV